MLGTIVCLSQPLRSFLPRGPFGSPWLWAALNSSRHSLPWVIDPRKRNITKLSISLTAEYDSNVELKCVIARLLTFFPKIRPQLFVLQEHLTVWHVETHSGKMLDCITEETCLLCFAFLPVIFPDRLFVRGRASNNKQRMNIILTDSPQNLLWGGSGVWVLSHTRWMEWWDLWVRFLASTRLGDVSFLWLSFSTY